MRTAATDSTGAEVWRVSTLGRVAGYTVAVALAAVGPAMAVGAVLTSDAGLALAFVCLAAVAFVLPAVLAFRFISRASVVVTSAGVTVRTTFNEHRADWADVVSATPGYGGITIRLRDGRSIVAGAVQKSNLAIWLKRETRADALADAINSRVRTCDS